MTEPEPMSETRAQAHAREGAEALKNTRAQARAREGGGWSVRCVRVPRDAGRVPLVFVELERDGLRLTFAVARLRGGHLDVRPPRGPDGCGAGLWMPARERKAVRALILAAVDGDGDARPVIKPYG